MGTYPKAFHVYEYSYPEEMPEVGGIVFYVGKATSLHRVDDHLRDAGNGRLGRKCDAIRSIWDAGFVPVRRIVFESLSEEEALNEERRRVHLHKSPYLTNVALIKSTYIDAKTKINNDEERLPLTYGRQEPSKDDWSISDQGWIPFLSRLKITPPTKGNKRTLGSILTKIQVNHPSVSWLHPALIVHGKVQYDGEYERRMEMESRGTSQLVPVVIKHKYRAGESHRICIGCDVFPIIPIQSINNCKRTGLASYKSPDISALLDNIESALDPTESTFSINGQGQRMPKIDMLALLRATESQ